MRARTAPLGLAAGLLLAAGAGSAGAHPIQFHQGGAFADPRGTQAFDGIADGPVTTRMAERDAAARQDGSIAGLPASRKDVEQVSKLKLTDVGGGVADVGYHDGFAYLNAFSPECQGRPGAQGTGVHVVDVRNPAAPKKVGFLPTEANAYVGEGVHVIELDGRDILVHNNEPCVGTTPSTLGVGVWDVTNPASPEKLGTIGDTTPAVANQQFHSVHSVQGFTWKGKAYAVAQDNNEPGTKDVDIFDITPMLSGGQAQLVNESGFLDFPGARSTYANGDNVFNHDIQQKVIGGRNFLAVSNWDAGQILLDISDPANPQFVTDSDYVGPDPEFPQFQQAEGNSHQSYWDQDGRWLLSSDEDFSATRTLFTITDGANAGQSAGGEFSWTKPIPAAGFTSSGGTVWGGSGCDQDLDGNGTSDRQDLPLASQTGADTAVFSRGGCFFSDKVRTAEERGYKAAVVGQSHGGTVNGTFRDGFICGAQGSAVLGTAHGLCIGHRAMHALFADEPAFLGAEFADMPAIGARGANVSGKTAFDGWGYVNLHDATKPDLPVVDTYAVAESKDPAFRSGFGDLSVHEVKTDPRRGKDLAYFSYYDAGLRVTTFGEDGIKEVGHFIDEGGNNFWGVFPMCIKACAQSQSGGAGDGRAIGQRPFLLMSDRDFGLYVLRYTGQE